ncbi:MAG: BRcat domain-containing protein [Thermoguttaceae bacterium]
MKNTEYLAKLIVGKVIDSMQSQFEGKVSVTTLNAVRSGAITTASNAIPFPLRLVINAVPNTIFENALARTDKAITMAVENSIKTINPNMLTDATGTSTVITEVVKTAVSRGIEMVNGFIKGKPADQTSDLNDSNGEEQSLHEANVPHHAKITLTLTIQVTCPNPNCNRKLKAKEEHLGRTLKCPVCQTAVTVPVASPE